MCIIFTIPSHFLYATGIFAVLLLRFRESLKVEIGIFFPLIVLRSLDVSEYPHNLKLSGKGGQLAVVNLL
ncbi:hypothetical protein L1987_09177 [Smallanthus sonchifolius]|uniref:Uncharacterized protein n=1 Tax=Smallanthus sonchifolius TaxID=185202 RepID=A0ACB9JNR6_9ASTR|nr:hypothetical protein L1987_09177 [Smallanthus sonchifolius]